LEILCSITFMDQHYEGKINWWEEMVVEAMLAALRVSCDFGCGGLEKSPAGYVLSKNEIWVGLVHD